MSIYDIGKKIQLNDIYVENSIIFLNSILKDIKEKILKKYKKYNKEYLIRNVWSYLFDSSLLNFDDIWIFKNDGSIYLNYEYLKKIFSSLSSSEKLILSLLIQQFCGSILDKLTKFRELPMMASISNVEKIYFIVELFDEYPLLFQNN